MISLSSFRIVYGHRIPTPLAIKTTSARHTTVVVTSSLRASGDCVPLDVRHRCVQHTHNHAAGRANVPTPTGGAIVVAHCRPLVVPFVVVTGTLVMVPEHHRRFTLIMCHCRSSLQYGHTNNGTNGRSGSNRQLSQRG